MVFVTGKGISDKFGKFSEDNIIAWAKEENEAGPDDDELSQRFWNQVMVVEALHPNQVADIVFAAIRDEQFYILTHPQYNIGIRRRLEDILQGHTPINTKTIIGLSE